MNRPDTERLEILLQAAEWLLKHEESELRDHEKAEFATWLKSSPLAVREYLRVARTAHLLPAVFRDGVTTNIGVASSEALIDQQTAQGLTPSARAILDLAQWQSSGSVQVPATKGGRQ